MIPIFPEDALSSSLVTTVWVGVIVVCFFNLRFGWNLTGLIVPGYLVPLIILKPWSAVAIIIEAIFTYTVVKAFSEFGPRLNLWCSLFGRDSFFAILLVSVITRVIFDSYFFPTFSTLFTKYTSIDFLYHGGLYSIGLVIVALIANQFWNNGLSKGIPEFLLTLLTTFLIIKYVFLEFTNFRLSDVAYLYESLATSIIASPKAYIILLITAYTASRMNLTYGWEFGGIAIPALIALLWYYPFEILTSISEAVIIFLIASFIIKTPLFVSSTIEGARKILLFFCIAFLYKLAVGFLLPLFFTDIQSADLYGFGYMLTSFIAIKMHDRQLGGRLISSTLITSAFSIVVATVIGYFLTFLDAPFQEIRYEKKCDEELLYDSTKTETISERLITFILRRIPYDYTQKTEQNLPKDIAHFSEALGLLDNYLGKQTIQNFIKLSVILQKIQYNIKKIDDKYIVLYGNRNTSRNGGTFIISTSQTLNYVAIIPYPLRSPELVAAVLTLLANGKIKAVAIAGENKNILELDSFFQSYLFPFSLYFQKYNKKLFFFDSAILKEESNFQTNYSWIELKNRDEILNNLFDQTLIFKQFQKLPDNFLASRVLNRQSTLFLSQEGISRILPTALTKIENSSNSVFSTKDICKRKTINKSMDVHECKFFDLRVITKILEGIKESRRDIIKSLGFVKFSANSLGYDLNLVAFPKDSKQEYIELSPKITAKTEGVFYFKTENFLPIILETAIPSKSVIKLVSRLSEELKPQAVFFDKLKYSNKNRENLLLNTNVTNYKRSIFNLTRQVTIRETDSQKLALNVIQVNQLPLSGKYAQKTIYISTDKGATDYYDLTNTEKKIYNALKNIGYEISFINGEKSTTGLEAIHSKYASYLNETEKTSFMILWNCSL